MPTIRESDKIAGVHLVEPQIHGDQRGLFIETYRREWFPNGREMVQVRLIGGEGCELPLPTTDFPHSETANRAPRRISLGLA